MYFDIKLNMWSLSC